MSVMKLQHQFEALARDLGLFGENWHVVEKAYVRGVEDARRELRAARRDSDKATTAADRAEA